VVEFYSLLKVFFGMRGTTREIERDCCDEAKYNFRLLVDDAHGFGTLGKQVLEQVRSKEFRMI
jgi:7-keto-8-aminopelargonate synthetase-like enzyme